jgi:hypothetical protein
MIERDLDVPPGIDAVRVSGTVTRRDVEDVVGPLLDAAVREGRRLRILSVIDGSFSGMTPGAVVEDLRAGTVVLRHLAGCGCCCAPSRSASRSCSASPPPTARSACSPERSACRTPGSRARGTGVRPARPGRIHVVTGLLARPAPTPSCGAHLSAARPSEV